MSSSILAAASSGAPSLKSRRLVSKTSPFYLALLEEVGGEDVGANQRVYLVTISRVLPGVAAATGYRHLDTLTRQDVEGMVRDSFDNPLPLPGTSAGRPRSRDGVLLELVVVAREVPARTRETEARIFSHRSHVRLLQSATRVRIFHSHQRGGKQT